MPQLDWSQARFRDGRGPGLGTRLDGPVPADALRRAHLDRAVEPSTCPRTPDADAAVVRLDPGLAFGSGTHPTTALCLHGWMRSPRRRLRGARVLDFGCGSRHPRARRAQARRRARDRRRQRSAGARSPRATTPNATASPSDSPCTCRDDEPAARPIRSSSPTSWPSRSDALADTLAARVAPGGRIALSGILAGQEERIARALRAHGSTTLAVAREGDWVRIDGRRRA